MNNRHMVLIPAYNEGRHIAKTVERLLACVGSYADVVVIDDGSTDQTGNLARRAGAHVIRIPSNRGYGQALQTGYRYAFEQGYVFLAQLDGDGQHAESYIAALFKWLETGDVDVVIGSRFADATLGGTYHAGWLKRSGMLFFAALASALVRQRMTDPTSGFRAFRHRVFPLLLHSAYPPQFPDADALVMLIRNGAVLRELPVPMYTKDERKSMHHGIGPLVYAFRMTYSTLRAAWRKPVTCGAIE